MHLCHDRTAYLLQLLLFVLEFLLVCALIAFQPLQHLRHFLQHALLLLLADVVVVVVDCVDGVLD